MGGKNLFIGNRTLSGSLLRNQRDFLIGLHYETESKLCPTNKSFISWLIRARLLGLASSLTVHFRNSSDSLAMLAAIRRASSFMPSSLVVLPWRVQPAAAELKTE